VPSLELTGAAEHAGKGLRGGSSAGQIADGEPIIPLVTEGPPEVADGDEREVQIGRNLWEGLSVEVAANDLLAGGKRDGLWHDQSPGVARRNSPTILPLHKHRGYNSLADPGV
jgi:hypothetical protein